MIPQGKNIFLWKIKNCAGGDCNAIVTAALAMGLDGISIKCTQGTGLYNMRWAVWHYVDDILPPLVTALHAAGLKVNGWGYVLGNDPVGEANIAVQRIRQLNLDGWEVDAEGDYKNKPASATIYMAELRRQLGISYSIGLTSYRYPTLHPEFPWHQFADSCDYHMPQVYWNPPVPPNYGPVPELNRSVRELRAIRDIPIVPAGRAYIGDGHPYPYPDELVCFMDRAQELNLPGFSFWGFDFLYLHAGGSARRDAIASFEVIPPAPPPPPPLPARVRTIGTINIRNAPHFNNTDVGDLYATGISVTGKEHEFYKVEGYVHESVVTPV